MFVMLDPDRLEQLTRQLVQVIRSAHENDQHLVLAALATASASFIAATGNPDMLEYFGRTLYVCMQNLVPDLEDPPAPRLN